MRKLIAILLVAMLFVPTFANASIPSIKELTDDELIELKNAIHNEQNQRGLLKEYEVPMGEWVVGVDIPVGKWVIKPVFDDFGMIEIYNNDDLLTAPFLKNDRDEVKTLTYELKEGYILKLTRCPMIFSVFTGLNFN